ncbi:MAG: HD domain-containing protein [Nocardioidaceae bacterium]
MTSASDRAADQLMGRWDEHFPGRQSLGRELLRRYSGVTRVYHDLRHLTDCLDNLDLLGPEASDPRLTELAAWFHDAVYDVRRDDNEERSAQLCEAALPAYDVHPTDVSEVARLVRLTRTHDPAAQDANGAVLCDADLAVLASDHQRYEDYTARVRSEYRHIGDPVFRRGRAEVLEQLLALPTLFHTKHGREHWEAPARANLLRELAALG